MRIWSLHPKYLDAKGLVALWRETLLAQAVLRGQTKGYKHHPQLLRFQAKKQALGALAEYLRVIQTEAAARGYNFDRSKISPARFRGKISVTRGQMDYEWKHLVKKLQRRDRKQLALIKNIKQPAAHPLFKITSGPIESWEKI